MAPASEAELTNPEEVGKNIWGLRVGKDLAPNSIPNRAFSISHNE
jgi:hypothetical protein